ncbi:MAG: right-handed parallel beta-helix repeat-containing protein [Acidobacteriota bacterium]|nr:right-handed parallel beta-helix repeat-containing protein [Acidobacteriota bacterium]
MRWKYGTFSIFAAGSGLALGLLAVLLMPLMVWGKGSQMTVTVGSAGADVIGTDNVAIQKAVDRVAAAGGGTVVIKAGTYLLVDSVRLASHIRLRGEGVEKTLLKKAPGVQCRLKLDADYGEAIATVENASGFASGMGVTILDKVSPGGWTPSVRTIIKVEGNTLHFDRFLGMDYSVENQGQVFNTFPLIAGFNVEDVQVEDLSVDGSRAGSGILDGCQAAGIYFFHSQRVTVRRCLAHDYPGDGISLQFVEDPVVENCEARGNAYLGIHLGTGALRAVVRDCRAHDNEQDGLFLCWRVQHARYERNQSWNNGRDGISLGHKDTDNVFIGNSCFGNAHAGVYFRNEVAANAASRNTFQENTIADNGRPGAPGYGIRIDGETRDLKILSNNFRSRRVEGVVVQPVGIYIGPKAGGIVANQNLFQGDLRKPIVDESPDAHNQSTPPSGQ